MSYIALYKYIETHTQIPETYNMLYLSNVVFFIVVGILSIAFRSLSPVFIYGYRMDYSNPLRANSTFLAASPGLNPPLDTQMRWPSPVSNLSWLLGQAQGQWWGKWTHAISTIPLATSLIINLYRSHRDMTLYMLASNTS